MVDDRPRRGRPGYDLESLVRVAAGVFNERGYDGTSVDDLARGLGISKAAIYHHVSGKEELLRLGAGRAVDGLASVVSEAAGMDSPAIDRLEHLIRGTCAVLEAELPYVTLLVRASASTEAGRELLERRREFDRFVAGLVKEAEREGDIRPDVDPAVTSRLLFGMVNSLVEWYQPPWRGPGSLADALCAVAFDGLRASG